MRDLYKHSNKMRLKGSDVLQGERPEGTNPGVCLVCGRFMEHIRDERCMTPECGELLKKLCMDRGLALQHVDDDAILWTALKVDPLFTELRHWLSEQPQVDHFAMERHTCKCKRALKMPHRPHCMHCYREGQHAAARNDREQRVKKRAPRPVANKIKGLDKIKL